MTHWSVETSTEKIGNFEPCRKVLFSSNKHYLNVIETETQFRVLQWQAKKLIDRQECKFLMQMLRLSVYRSFWSVCDPVSIAIDNKNGNFHGVFNLPRYIIFSMTINELFTIVLCLLRAMFTSIVWSFCIYLANQIV